MFLSDAPQLELAPFPFQYALMLPVGIANWGDDLLEDLGKTTAQELKKASSGRCALLKNVFA